VPQKVPNHVCHDVPQTYCHKVPIKVPEEVCTQHPKKDCHEEPYQVPRKVPRKEGGSVNNQHFCMFISLLEYFYHSGHILCSY
jgi:hypothetical protein